MPDEFISDWITNLSNRGAMDELVKGSLDGLSQQNVVALLESEVKSSVAQGLREDVGPLKELDLDFADY